MDPISIPVLQGALQEAFLLREGKELLSEGNQKLVTRWGSSQQMSLKECRKPLWGIGEAYLQVSWSTSSGCYSSHWDHQSNKQILSVIHEQNIESNESRCQIDFSLDYSGY